MLRFHFMISGRMKTQGQYFLAQKTDICMFWASQTKGVLAFKEIAGQEYKANNSCLLCPHGSLKPEHTNVWFWSSIRVRVCNHALLRKGGVKAEKTCPLPAEKANEVRVRHSIHAYEKGLPAEGWKKPPEEIIDQGLRKGTRKAPGLPPWRFRKGLWS